MRRGLLVLVSCGLSVLTAQTEDAQGLFVKAKDLIERNCGDCHGATDEALQKGIELMEQVLASGHQERAAGLKLLAEGYRTKYFVYPVADENRMRQMLQRRKEIYEELTLIDPEDWDAGLELAKLLEEPKAREGAYRSLLQKNPQHYETRFALGALLVDTGRINPGRDEMMRAVRMAEPAKAYEYAIIGARLLRRQGLNKKAKEIEDLGKQRVKP